jgi:hypothetical protein
MIYTQVGSVSLLRRGKPFNIDKLLKFNRTLLRLRALYIKNLIKAKGPY